MRKIMRALALGSLAALPALVSATALTLDLTGTGGTAGVNFHGTDQFPAAMAAMTNGDTLDIVESGTYTGTGGANIPGPKTDVIVRATTATVVITDSTQDPVKIQSTGGSVSATFQNLTFQASSSVSKDAFAITQGANGSGYMTTITLTNCTISNPASATNAAACVLFGATGGSTGLDVTPGTTCTLIANNCYFHHSNNGRANIDFRASSAGNNFQNFNCFLTNCKLTNDGTGSNGVFDMTSPSGFHRNHLRVTNCNISDNNIAGKALVHFDISTATSGFSYNEVKFTSCTMTSAKNQAFNFSDTVANTTNNVGGNTIVIDRCTMDNHTNSTPAANFFSFSNGGTINPSQVTIQNCLILTGSGAVAGARAIQSQTGGSNLKIYHNTMVALNASGVSTQGDAAIELTNAATFLSYTASDNIFYNYYEPISGSNSTSQHVATTVTNTATNKNNLTVGSFTDTGDLSDASNLVDSVAPVLGTNDLDFNYYPLASSSPVGNAGSFYGDGAIGDAISNLDRSGASRNATVNANHYDIGAFQLAPTTPVELSTFTAE